MLITNRLKKWDCLGLKGVPAMARRNYLIEVRHMMMWGIFAGMFEGTVSSVVAAKTFNAGPWLITIVMAAPMFANLMGLLWGTIATGRRKVPLLMLLASGAVGLVGSIALVPANEWGGWIFAVQIVLARVLLSGCMTVRSGLWKHNYPVTHRGRVAARLQLFRFSLGITTVIIASILFDINPLIYVYLYPIAAIAGAAAIIALRPMHVRGEKTQLRRMTRDRHRQRSPITRGFFGPARSALGVLRSDHHFRRYIIAMSLLGSANIMIMPIMTIIITRELLLSYFHSCNLMEVLPRVLMMASLLPWAGLFDRVGVVRFRVVSACLSAGTALFGGLGAAMIAVRGLDTVSDFTLAVSLIAFSRMFEGLGKGGGAIAWNLGHLHFAKSANAEIYMGIHVFFTGLRGMIAPFLGTFLYMRYGTVVFIVSFALAISGIIAFANLSRRQRRDLAKRKAISKSAAAASSDRSSTIETG